MKIKEFWWVVVVIVIVVSLLIKTTNASAEEAKDCVELVKPGNSIYLHMKCDGSAHIYWATYNIQYNHGSIKTKEGTHTNRYMDPFNRPLKMDEFGNVTPDYLRWLSKLNYTHLTKKGEKLVLLDQSGLNTTSRTEKSGDYYLYIWANDDAHGRYIYWCKKNGVSLSWR